MRAIGLDIGGANLKIADATGSAKSVPFALWKQPGDLTDMLRTILQDVEAFDVLAVTMTGELCDCFATKREGVHHILDAVNAAIGAFATPRETTKGAAGFSPRGAALRQNPKFSESPTILVWQTDGRFVRPDTARQRIHHTAAANWHALASFAAKLAGPSLGLLIDTGSTTTDIIPLADGHPVPQGTTDTQRLATGELVYTGVGRTPICAVTSRLNLDGQPHRVAAEFFATMHDAHLLAGDATENPNDCDTADGQPATKEHAAARIVRMICADLETLSKNDAHDLARQIITAQESQIAGAIRSAASRLDRPVETVVTSGSGEFLARRLAKSVFGPDVRVISFADRFGRDVSDAACAFALAHLAIEAESADDD